MLKKFIYFLYKKYVEPEDRFIKKREPLEKKRATELGFACKDLLMKGHLREIASQVVEESEYRQLYLSEEPQIERAFRDGVGALIKKVDYYARKIETKEEQVKNRHAAI